MLELFTRHGAFDLELKCDGDLDVDQHHTVEDVGIALGEAFDRALGDKRGILRAGYFLMPMDETLAIAAVDLSGRAACAVDTKVKTRLVGDLQTELVADFFEGFARGARANVHVKTMYGRSNHHKIEAIFKAFARALRVACSRDKQMGEMLPSTKGLLALMRVTVIDYKAGNLTSVLKALRHLGAEPMVTDADLIAGRVGGADRAAGRGAFCGDASDWMHGPDGGNSRERSRAAFRFWASAWACSGCMRGRPKLPRSARAWAFQGDPARAFAESDQKVPHVGWNSLEIKLRLAAACGSEPGEFVYFTHSYVLRSRRYRGDHRIHRDFRRGGRTRQCDGRAVSSGKIGRDGVEDPTNFLVECGDDADQAHHRLPGCHAGRVVKGVQFVDIVDAGDPAALAARHAREGADEIVLLDITATHEGRQTLLDTVRRTARELFVPFMRGRRNSQRGGCGAGVRRGRGQGQHQLRCACRSRC